MKCRHCRQTLVAPVLKLRQPSLSEDVMVAQEQRRFRQGRTGERGERTFTRDSGQGGRWWGQVCGSELVRGTEWCVEQSRRVQRAPFEGTRQTRGEAIWLRYAPRTTGRGPRAKDHALRTAPRFDHLTRPPRTPPPLDTAAKVGVATFMLGPVGLAGGLAWAANREVSGEDEIILPSKVPR